MCGRYSFSKSEAEIVKRFDARPTDPLSPNYNAAPSQKLPVILNTDIKHITPIKWGIKPVWFKPQAGRREALINIRAENLKEKPTFKKDLRERRCLVLADGFYEWKKTKDGKIPYRFVLKTGEPFAFAGLWEEHDGIRQFAIITTEPNTLAKKIHNRMPVILEKNEERAWLADLSEANALDMLDAYSANKMNAYPISTKVNKASYNKSDILDHI
jgi:putative SOS response-associated peptidase YedK